MKFNIANKENGKQKSWTVDDEQKWGRLIDVKIGFEFDAAEVLGEEWAGYVLKITGGMDAEGFGMKQGIFKKGRVKLLLGDGATGYVCNRDGARRRKSVRGCIVGRDIGTLHCIIVRKGDKDIEGLTDAQTPRRLGPKRANRIRKFFGLARHSTNTGKKETEKVQIDRFDVTRYIVKRTTKEVAGKTFYKVLNFN